MCTDRILLSFHENHYRCCVYGIYLCTSSVVTLSRTSRCSCSLLREMWKHCPLRGLVIESIGDSLFKSLKIFSPQDERGVLK